MSDILKIQRDFQKHLYQKSNQKIIAELPYSRLESLARLNIYRNNVFGNFNSVLSSIFEAVKKLVGEEYFEFLCDEYNQNHFSKNGNLDNYGEEFPQFLATIKTKHKLALLPDLARLELLYHKSYYAADAENFDLETFKKISPENFENLTFELHPSCFLIASKFPIYSIWNNSVNGENKKVSLLKKAEFAMVERTSQKLQIHKIDEKEFFFLQNINKKTLFKTYKLISKKTKNDCNIGALLNKFITNGIIIKFNKADSAILR